MVSVAAQNLPDDVEIRLVICDNDVEPSARQVVEQAGAQLGLQTLYVHAPAQNISLARNACLDAATAPFLAFLDDDEIADPAWLQHLLTRQAETGADVVFGLVRAVYGAELPAWAAKADLHTTPSPVRRDGTIVTGYAGNVLIRTAVLSGRRFDLELGRSGGEDTFFFHGLGRAGARFAFAEKALALEPVPANRVRTQWLVKRSFRAGQTHARLLRSEGANRGTGVVLALAKFAYCAADTALHALSPSERRRRMTRAALHAGVASGLAGRREIELY